MRGWHVLVLSFGLLATAMEGAMIGFGASALIDLGFADAAAARLTSAFFGAFLLGRLSLCWLGRRVEPGPLVLAGFGGIAVLLGAAALGAPAWGFVGAGAFAGVTFPAFYIWAVGLLGPDPRMGSAVLALYLLGATGGPLALRPLLAAFGEGAVFGVVAVVGAMVAAAFTIMLHMVCQDGTSRRRSWSWGSRLKCRPVDAIACSRLAWVSRSASM